MKPKVAIVYHFFADYRGPILSHLANDDEFDFYFISDSKNRVMPGVPIWTSCPEDRSIDARCYPIFLDFMLQAGLLRLAVDKRFSTIVYLGDWKWPCTWASAILARLLGKRVLFWTHGWKQMEHGIVGFFRKRFYSIAHGLLLYGNRAREIGIAKGFQAKSLYVLFNSLEHSKQIELRERSVDRDSIARSLFECSDRPILICCSRLQTSKRIDLLFEAAKLLHEDGHSVNIVIIGDGPARESLERLAIDLGISVHFEGASYDEERNSVLFKSSSLTVVPGPIGLTAIHSLTYGVPIVSTDNMSEQKPEAEAIVEGKTGSFYRDGDVRSLADAISNWTKSIIPSDRTRLLCYSIVDKFYNPIYQTRVIKCAIRAEESEVIVFGKSRNNGEAEFYESD